MSGGAIAVAVDGSPASTAAVAAAVGAAQAAGLPLQGVFVLDTGWADYIGNDWQSSAGARQGFLDYVRGQLETQAEAARRQFAAATVGLAAARFTVIPGEPLETLCELVEGGAATTLYAGREVFQVCGRPSLRRLPQELCRRIGAAVTIL